MRYKIYKIISLVLLINLPSCVTSREKWRTSENLKSNAKSRVLGDWIKSQDTDTPQKNTKIRAAGTNKLKMSYAYRNNQENQILSFKDKGDHLVISGLSRRTGYFPFFWVKPSTVSMGVNDKGEMTTHYNYSAALYIGPLPMFFVGTGEPITRYFEPIRKINKANKLQ